MLYLAAGSRHPKAQVASRWGCAAARAGGVSEDSRESETAIFVEIKSVLERMPANDCRERLQRQIAEKREEREALLQLMVERERTREAQKRLADAKARSEAREIELSSLRAAADGVARATVSQTDGPGQGVGLLAVPTIGYHPAALASEASVGAAKTQSQKMLLQLDVVRQERDSLIQQKRERTLRGQACERLGAPNNLHNRGAQSTTRTTGPMAVKQTLSGAVQELMGVTDTIALFRACATSSTFPESMVLDIEERDVIFGTGATGDALVRAGSIEQAGFYRELVGYDRCISKSDLLAYLSRDGKREVFGLLVAAADHRQDGRLGPDELVAIMGLCKHYVLTYGAHGHSVDFRTTILGPLALQINQQGALEPKDELGETGEVQEVMLTVMGVEHLPPTADGDLDACVYAYQRDFEPSAASPTTSVASFKNGERQTGAWYDALTTIAKGGERGGGGGDDPCCTHDCTCFICDCDCWLLVLLLPGDTPRKSSDGVQLALPMAAHTPLHARCPLLTISRRRAALVCCRHGSWSIWCWYDPINICFGKSGVKYSNGKSC